VVWAQLIVAGLLEVVGAVGLKFTAGFTRIGVSALVIVALAASFYLLSAAVEVLPVGTAYAVWTGIGATGTAVAGMIWLGESRNAKRFASLLLVVAGSVGMKFFS
jgi:quaternary ammonium compound-resistance protein SugE